MFDRVTTETPAGAGGEQRIVRRTRALTQPRLHNGARARHQRCSALLSALAGVVTAYKDLANVERDFRHIKVDDLSLRPIHHRLEARVRSHVFICMLAAYLVWHLRETLAPLTFTDEHSPTRDNPVAPAVRSKSASRKAATKRNGADEEVRGFRELLDHLATLTRNTMRVATETGSSFELLSTPTPIQRRAFELLGAAAPRHLK